MAVKPSGQTATSWPRRGSSMLISSWMVGSSSANKIFSRALGGESLFLSLMAMLFLRANQGKRNGKARTAPWSVALPDDAPAVVLNDAIRDGKSESRAAAVAAAGEKWFKQMLAHFVSHTAAVVADDDFGLRI